MKRTKKIPGLLLILLMLLSTTAFAATPIDSVEFHVTTPVLDAAPAVDFTVTAGCSIDEYYWEKYIPGEDPDWIPLEEDSTFSEGYYHLLVVLDAGDGCEFTEDTEFLLNGERLPEYDSVYHGISSYYIYDSESKWAELDLWFTVGDPATYTVSFDANGGIGTMAAVSGIWDWYPLPECTFTAPAGKAFKCWSVDGEKKNVGDQIVLTEDTTVTALWGTPIRTITISGITRPVVGQKAVTTGITLVAEGMTIDPVHKMFWVDAGDPNYPNNRYHMGGDTRLFKVGLTYPLYIYYTVADGYVVAEDVEVIHDLPGAVVTVNRMADHPNVQLNYTVSEVETYTVTFAAGGGSGAMAPVSGVSGNYLLPACTFTAPAGKQFKCWSVDGVEKAVGDKINVTADTVATAVWRAQHLSVGGTVSVSGSSAAAKVTVAGLPETEATLLVAQYRGGQMVAAKMDTVTADGTCTLNGFSHQSGDTYKAFLVDAVTQVPLCSEASF